jgi:hypothetical protein
MHKIFEVQFATDLLAQVSANPSKRFAVYRNNVFVSLVEALKARFPAVQNAVGAAFFEALARDYAGSNPPTSPLMMQYGESFPAYIEGFAPLAEYSWISDLARLECAITKSYHAADTEPLGPVAFTTILPEALSRLRVALHPAAHLIQSRFPIVRLWQMNSGQAEITPLDDHPAETALIHRPQLTVSVKAISPAGGSFLYALSERHTLAEAADIGAAEDSAFDLIAHLHLLIAEGLVTAFIPDQTH